MGHTFLPFLSPIKLHFYESQHTAHLLPQILFVLETANT